MIQSFSEPGDTNSNDAPGSLGIVDVLLYDDAMKAKILRGTVTIIMD